MSQPLYELEIEDEFGAPNLPEAQMRAAMEWVLKVHQTPPTTAITVLISDDDHVQSLNREFRGVDAPTDILSFTADPIPDDLRAMMSESGEEEPLYLGDLIIAYPYTQRHAHEAGHSMEDELTLLVIHGTLHLLGYDHDTPEHQDLMWARQKDALDAMGIALEVPRFTFEENPDE